MIVGDFGEGIGVGDHQLCLFHTFGKRVGSVEVVSVYNSAVDWGAEESGGKGCESPGTTSPEEPDLMVGWWSACEPDASLRAPLVLEREGCVIYLTRPFILWRDKHKKKVI